MKIAQSLLCAAVCAVAVSFAANASAQTKPGTATVVRIYGQARYTDDGTTWHSLIVGQSLGAGSIIQTATGASVDLVLGNQLVSRVTSLSPYGPGYAADPNVVGIRPVKAVSAQNAIHVSSDTVLAIDKLAVGDNGVQGVGDTELDLRQGTIFGNVKKLSATSQFLVKIPNGIAGIRGTTFTVSADGSVSVTEGTLVISMNGQPVITITAGNSWSQSGGAQTLTQGQIAAIEAELQYLVAENGGNNQIVTAPDTTTIYISPDTGISAKTQPST